MGSSANLCQVIILIHLAMYQVTFFHYLIRMLQMCVHQQFNSNILQARNRLVMGELNLLCLAQPNHVVFVEVLMCASCMETGAPRPQQQVLLPARAPQFPPNNISEQMSG
jgi:hypothetical protein